MFERTEETYDPEPEMRSEALHLAQEHMGSVCKPEEITDCAEVFLEFLRTGKSPKREGTGGFSPKIVSAN